MVVPIALIALLFVLKGVRSVGRSMARLVESTQELRDVGLGLSQLRDDLAARRATGDEAPPQ
ncbi:MAG: hypothetical protein QOI99_2380 [Actinomycetota bacterium]|nr:hypothetical protein [Actinomycetota bacterium]